ncbi:MAG: glutathione synthase [Deltaproteobacteria bacterium]|nr:glutathione synthase [Deltaproteobacteria bacterium]
MTKNLALAFIADPLANFNPLHETTFFIMAEANKRGWDCFHIELQGLSAQNESVWGQASQVSVSQNKQGGFEYNIKDKRKIDLASCDAVLLRKDPPVNMAFLDHLSLLDLLQNKTLLVNNPSSVKIANEKLFPLQFKDIMPDTLVSQNAASLREFIQEQKTAVIKPLNEAGGRGVVLLKHDDPSLGSLLDLLTKNNSEFLMAQQFLPEARKGDKRILLLDGEVLGSFLRVPHQDDFRGNLHSGATLKKSPVSKEEQALVDQISPRLQEMGLYFVGLDLIGSHVTEINSTSPMGISEINHLDNTRCEAQFCDWLKNKIKSAR